MDRKAWVYGKPAVLGNSPGKNRQLLQTWRQGQIMFPILKHYSKIVKLAVHSKATICMHRTDLVEIPTWFTKPTKISCIQKSHLQSNISNERMNLDKVKDILIMISRIGFSWRVPEFVELYWPIIRLYKVEPSIRSVLYIIEATCEMITGYLEICIKMKPRKWVPEPHNVGILEERNTKVSI